LASGAADEVRVHHQSESGKADRLDDSTERAGAGGSSHQMTVVSGQLSVVGDNTGAKLMSGKFFVWLLTTVLLSTAPPADAQQTKKVARIGVLSQSNANFMSTQLE